MTKTPITKIDKGNILLYGLGFSLIELMIVLVAVGVLVAIAIPNFLFFIQQARGTEAQQTLASGLRAQEARHMELGRFASGWEELGLEIESNQYNYKSLAPEPVKAAMLRAIPKDKKITGYVAGIEVITTKRHGQEYKSVICRAVKPGIQVIQEAEVEFRKRRVVCNNKFKKVG